MKRALMAMFVLLAINLLTLGGARALEVEDAHSTGCLPRSAKPQQACAACHKQDADSRWRSAQATPCTPYCATCHKKEETERHHSVNAELSVESQDVTLHLAQGKLMGCTTCHDLSRPRFDSVRWKAASLFERMFRESPQYKTYFLSMRNETGQLCLVCH